MEKVKEATKPMTLRLASSILKKMEKYSTTPSSFIKEAISVHLAAKEKEELIHAYAEAVQSAQRESEEINKDFFAAARVAYSNEE